MPANPTTTATLELNAVDNATSVIRNVGKTVDDLGKSYDRLKGAVESLAGVFTAGMFADWVGGAIESINKLRELSIATGVSVETLSALRVVAEQSGTGMDQVATMVQRLSKNLYEFATTGQGKAAEAFEQLGFNQAQARGAMQNMNAFLPEFAQKLLSSGTATERVAMAQLLLGRAGAQALPFLHELAETGQLSSKVTSDQAEQAHQYHLRLVELRESAYDLKVQMADGLLPALTQILEAFTKLKGKQGDFTGFFEGIGAVMQWAARIAVGLWTTLRVIADGISAEIEAIGKLREFDFKGAMGSVSGFADRTSASLQSAGQMMQGLTAQPPGAHAGANGGGDTLGSRAKDRTREDEAQARAVQQAEDEAAKTMTDAWIAFNNTVIASDKERAAIEKQLADDQALMWKQVFGSIDKEQDDAIAQGAALLKDLDAKTKSTDDFARQMGLTFSSSFEAAITKGKSFRDVLKGIDQDIAAIIVRKSITEPLGTSISSAVTQSGIGDAIKSLFAGNHASGGFIPPGMWGITGEAGPEPVFGGSTGATVLPNSSLQGGGDLNVTINAAGADPAALQRVVGAVRALHASFNQRSVSAVVRAFNQRGIPTGIGGA